MKNADLSSWRKTIDKLDHQIVQLLARRMKLVLQIGAYKKKHDIALLDVARWRQVLRSKLLLAQKLGLNQDIVKDIYEHIHKAALDLELSVQKDIKI